MALTEQSTTKIEILGNEAYRTFQIRTDNHILRDGVVISKGNYHRHTLVPGYLDQDDVYQRTDTSGETSEVQNIANLCWTDAAHTAYEAYLRQ